MATPNYKLKNDHGATIGHVRELYTKVVNEFRTLSDSYSKAATDETNASFLKLDGTRSVTNTLAYS